MFRTKKRPRIDKTALPIGIAAKAPKDEPGMSERHLRFLRGLPCVVCAAGVSLEDEQHLPRAGTAHHLCSVRDRRGMSIKELDMYAVPLCPEHHTGKAGVHQVGSKLERAWFAGYGVPDVLALCARYCKASPDPSIREAWKEMRT